ncbi:MAG: hypothetical protein FJ125_05660, partial [Deltaproteobacteria bacterium]|nr:hypothetical protein [Deltaproteobacteria bacterium]
MPATKRPVDLLLPAAAGGAARPAPTAALTALLLAASLAACNEVPTDNPYDPALPEQQQAPGELLLELQLEDAQLLRRFPAQQAAEQIVLRALLARDGKLVRTSDLRLSEIAEDRAAIQFSGLIPGSYQLRLEDPLQLFDVPVFAELRVGIAARRVEQISLLRQRGTAIVLTQRDGERNGPICLGLLPSPQPQGECEASYSEVLRAFSLLSQGRADPCLAIPGSGSSAGASGSGAGDGTASAGATLQQRYFWFRQTEQDGSVDFREIPRVFPHHCLVVVARNHPIQVKTLFRTGGNDQAVVALPRFHGTLALRTFDEVAQACGGEGPCSFRPSALDAAGRRVSRQRLIFLDPRPMVGDQRFDPVVGLQVADSPPGSAASPEELLAAPGTTRF